MASSPKAGRRTAALGALWRVFRQSRNPGAPTLGQLMAAVPRMLWARTRGKYTGLGFGRMAGMVLAAGYVLSPIDLMPEAFLLIFGLADDAFVLTWFAGALLGEAERFVEWEREQRGIIAGETLYRTASTRVS